MDICNQFNWIVCYFISLWSLLLPESSKIQMLEQKLLLNKFTSPWKLSDKFFQNKNVNIDILIRRLVLSIVKLDLIYLHYHNPLFQIICSLWNPFLIKLRIINLHMELYAQALLLQLHIASFGLHFAPMTGYWSTLKSNCSSFNHLSLLDLFLRRYNQEISKMSTECWNQCVENSDINLELGHPIGLLVCLCLLYQLWDLLPNFLQLPQGLLMSRELLISFKTLDLDRYLSKTHQTFLFFIYLKWNSWILMLPSIELGLECFRLIFLELMLLKIKVDFSL